MPTATAASQASERVIRRRRGIVPVDFRELWHFRELFAFLVWRDVLIRYKQTLIGVAWAVVQPVATMVVFTVVFGRLARMADDTTAPYAVLTFAGVLPWQYFSTALTLSSQSMVGSSNLVAKVYFPRLIVPTSKVLMGVVDFLVALAILFGLMLYYRVAFRPELLLLPLFFGLAVALSLGIGYWFSALNVTYRDVQYVVPFMVRLGMYISPIGYKTEVVPEAWRFWYGLNPMVGVIDGFRWAILGREFEPMWGSFWASVGLTAAIFVSGVYFFRSTERTFADVI